MANKAGPLTTFSIDDVIQPIYTGGDVSIDSSGLILATCLGEDAVLTHVQKGTLLARIDGVSLGKIDSTNRRILITKYRTESR